MPDSKKKLKRVVIKEELIALTGDWLQAVILNQFLYWGQRRNDYDAFILEERLRRSEPDLELTHGWIWKSAREMVEEIMVEPLSEDTVRRRISELVAVGWLEQRNNPIHKWDRTLQYRPNILQIQRDLQALGYALEGYPLLTENSAIPQDAESRLQDAESNPDSAESNPDGAGALPETTLETTPEITSKEGGKAPNADSHSSTDLPDSKAQMAVLFPSCGSGSVRDFMQSIQMAGWEIRNVDIRRAAALFLKHSSLPIPNNETTRGGWLKSLKQHVDDFGVPVLEELYPLAIADLRKGDCIVSRPGSLTNTLPDVCLKWKNGGPNAPHSPNYPKTSGVSDYYVAPPIDHEESERIRAEIHASLAAEGVGRTGGVP